MSSNPSAQDVARFVGARMRQRRIELGLSQQGLAMLLGVTYQQIHKYETGVSQLASVRLFALAVALDVDIGYFFEGLGAGSEPNQGQRVILDLVRDFRAITCAKRKEALLLLARTLSETGPESNPLAI